MKQILTELYEFGFDTTAKENADEIINNFRKFIDENKDEIIALKNSLLPAGTTQRT